MSALGNFVSEIRVFKMGSGSWPCGLVEARSHMACYLLGILSQQLANTPGACACVCPKCWQGEEIQEKGLWRDHVPLWGRVSLFLSFSISLCLFLQVIAPSGNKRKKDRQHWQLKGELYDERSEKVSGNWSEHINSFSCSFLCPYSVLINFILLRAEESFRIQSNKAVVHSLIHGESLLFW